MTIPTDNTINSIIIRQAEEQDAAAICHLRKKLWVATYSQPEYQTSLAKQDFTSAQQIAHFAASIVDNLQYCHLIAERHRQIIGWAAAHISQNEIVALYVDTPFQNCGIGRRFYQRLDEKLDNQRDIHIYTVLGNQRAIDFYQKRGFVTVSCPDAEQQRQGLQNHQLPVLKMTKAAANI